MDGVKGFNIPVKEMSKAVSFYHRVFGWEIGPIRGSGGYFHGAQTTETDPNGYPSFPGFINGGLFLMGTHGIDSTFLEVQVDSIDKCVEMVVAEGGSVVRPKAKMLNFAYFAIVKDPDGNALGLWEEL